MDLANNRKVEYDVWQYFDFYQSLAGTEHFTLKNCRGFEPLFCFVSFLLKSVSLQDYQVHNFWTLLFIVLMVRVIFLASEKIPAYCLLLPVLMFNFFNPTEVYFLTRQFVAGAFLLSMFMSKSEKGMYIWGACACLLHQFVVPFVIFYILIYSKVRVRLIITTVLLICMIAVILPNEFNLLKSSLLHKIHLYKSKSDGAITVLQEIKFALYFFICMILADNRGKLFFIMCALFYLLTFTNEMAHLRYHKYLYFIFIYGFLSAQKVVFYQFAMITSGVGLWRVFGLFR